MQTGKTTNHNSESKCLCNLAFAHTQLKHYQAAVESFTLALTKAKAAKNPYLQFQACEGLGAATFHLGQHTEAITNFNQALAVLDEIKQDTGIPRERVMEKLSDALEALQLQAHQQQHQQQQEERHSPKSFRTRSPRLSPEAVHEYHGSGGSDVDERTSPKIRILTTSVEVHSTGSTHSLDSAGKRSPRLLTRRHHAVAPDPHSITKTPHSILNVESLPLPDKKGTGFLPPLDPSRSPQLTTRQDHQISLATSTPAPTTETRRRARKHAKVTPSHSKGKKRSLPQITENRTKPLPESYDDELRAYVNSYKEDKSGGSDMNSSSENSLSGGSQLSQESGDKLGASIFSRHATTRHSHGPHPLPKISLPPHSLSQGHSPLHSPPPFLVQEGSLALGPNARETFTTQTQLVRPKRRTKRNPRVQTRIVPKSSLNGPKTSPDPLDDPDYTDPLGHHQQSSKVCLLL